MSSPSDRTATRRDFLRATAAGAAGLVIGGTATSADSRPPLGTAKSCIFINLVGGPSQLDTFDPKPLARSDVRGPFRPIPTRVPGVHLSELFPKLAGLTDKFSLIRSLHHDAPPIHEAGFQLLNTGRLFRDGPAWPSVGSVVSYLKGESGPCVIPSREINTGVRVACGLGTAHLPVEVKEWPQAERGFIQKTAFDVRYGANTFGENCHWAALFSHPGMHPFVTVNMFPTVFDAPSWDCHADRGSLATDLNDYRDIIAPAFDLAFAALLTHLEDRGRLDSTLVVATGEFGRTPFLNANGGRDHWANCWTALVAGGGVKGGRVVGSSDDLGGEPKDRPVTPQELVATIFHALGVPPDATIPGPDGSPVAVYPGRPVTEMF